MLELSERTKEHFRNPLNVGEMENPDAMASIDNPVCGDTTKLYLRVKNDVVEDARFLSFGCAVTIASASVFTERIKGKALGGIFSGSDGEVIERLVQLIESELGSIPPVKLHCPPATVQAFLEAIAQYKIRMGETDLGSRIARLVSRVSDYYKRGDSSDLDR